MVNYIETHLSDPTEYFGAEEGESLGFMSNNMEIINVVGRRIDVG